jgi:hypothetical protein
LVYNVAFKGFMVPTQAGFPEGYDLGKQFEFTYGVTERQKMTFEIEVQTYLPLTDRREEFSAGNTMQNTSVNYNIAAGAGSTGATGTGGGGGAEGPEFCRTEDDKITPGATYSPSQGEQNYTNPTDES